MTPTMRFERIRPDLEVHGDAVQRPWVIVLSDWAQNDSLLNQVRVVVSRVNELFERAEPRGAVPLVLVVDDMYLHGWTEPRRQLVADLAEAGASILQPEGEAETRAAEKDPLGVADDQLRAAMTVVQLLAAPPPAAPVSEPDGYTEFGRAFTRLSPEELADVIEGCRRGAACPRQP
jgi:hypothetical protein